MDKKRIHIAAGIILNPDYSQIFITQRPAKAHKGGFWEFAGGQVEHGETAEQAVIRELEEEVGITATVVEAFMSMTHDYPDKALTFDFFLIKAFDGVPYGKEGQPGQWVEILALSGFEFPEANSPVLAKIQEMFA
ncbi:7,8-dihydro-8-oxoguanine-triphosphatase [Enterovibrio norvegicus FF-33]|uniref:8-oxo-dGTP diphosphatase n=1 Tax=Enterovibrio norvegicus FF-454 TaxID=1185651 RepID=A0A1E5BX98_9GAMM|nr:8-oxo-dGTP diphosphatase MutT [Enterovibrio norvegicus]OEE57906.1 7,8-dihydro-8-oxoguanine-triphosphatase [Enterovibrio norvegicus FF-454]OEE70545.1 7,8-dihydro-8-oxoguanine-triphosphatase [Enterovibrio norvegicus FF-33]OEE87389.1 7,8-dihydro-8-oxoguanine-triphosphatase [Enterovibrio norvegicus FF-162]